MNILKNILKSSKSDIELKLEESYFQQYRTMGFSKEDIQSIISDCKKEAEIKGDINLGNDFGSELISKAKQGDRSSVRAVENRVRGGATEKDIINWWRLNFLERRMMNWEDDVMRLTIFKSLQSEKGMSADQAIIKLRKTFPIYGDPTDETNSTGEDRPLPHELHLRINQLIKKLDPKILNEESSKFTTMNAYLRAKLHI